MIAPIMFLATQMSRRRLSGGYSNPTPENNNWFGVVCFVAVVGVLCVGALIVAVKATNEERPRVEETSQQSLREEK